MRILINISLAVLFLTNLSCERLFPDYDNDLELLDTREDCLAAINGAYGKFREAMIYHNFFTVKSDDINLRLIDHDCYNRGDMPVEVSADFYRLMYKSVLMCNRVIFDLTNHEPGPDLEEFLGEAYFLRAYIYFKLSRIYGRVPLVKDMDVNYEMELPAFRELYEFIIDGLEKAQDLLPPGPFSSRIPGVTPHAGVAKAFLAEVYLSFAGYPVKDESMYAKAAAVAGEVIDNADYYSFALSADYASLWNWDTHDNPESILRFYYEPDKEHPEAVFFGEYWWTYVPAPTISYYNAFPSNYRKEVSLATMYSDIRSYEVDDITYNDRIMVDVDTTTLCSFYSKCFGKKQTWNFQTDQIYGNLTYEAYNHWASRDIYWNYRYTNGRPPFSTYYHLLRYAQTLLTFAEAKARSGNADATAYEALNMVRRRAEALDFNSPSPVDLTPGSLSTEAFADSVVAERSWELCHEFEGRWFDIVRLELLDEIEAKARPGDLIFYGISTLYGSNRYFVTLPDMDLWLNPNLDDDEEDE